MTSLFGLFAQTLSAQGIFNEMSYQQGMTEFRLNAPTEATLRIYDNGSDTKAAKTVKMKQPAMANGWPR